MQTAIYMRVSTTQQASEGQSLEAQEKILKDYAANHPNIIIVDTYVDDGISGTKFDQRDELQRLLSDVKSGKIKLILFTKLDRFFRLVPVTHYKKEKASSLLFLIIDKSYS